MRSMDVLRSAYCVVAVLLFAASSAASGQSSPRSTAQTQSAERVSFGVTVSRDTVTIGEPFEVRVRVRAPADADIRFPENPDTAGTVQARDPRTIATTDSVQWRDQTATYHVAAWEVGRQRVRLDDAVVVWKGRASFGERRVPLDTINVFVRSVLPADTALRVPRPARPLWETSPFPWWIVVLAVALAAVLWWWSRRRRGRPAAAVGHIDPYQRAQREFDRIEALGLVDAGERTRFVTLAIEVLRDYLAARHPDALLALTSRELIAAMRRYHTVPADALARALHEADLAKFAGMAFTPERARALSRETRSIVEREHAAAQPPDQAAA